MILLGSKVKDKVTGFEGVAVSRIEYLNGCTQYGVLPYYSETKMEGEYPKVEYIDEGQLKVIAGSTVWVDPREDKKTEPVKQPPGGLQSARPRK